MEKILSIYQDWCLVFPPQILLRDLQYLLFVTYIIYPKAGSKAATGIWNMGYRWPVSTVPEAHDHVLFLSTIHFLYTLVGTTHGLQGPQHLSLLRLGLPLGDNLTCVSQWQLETGSTKLYDSMTWLSAKTYKLVLCLPLTSIQLVGHPLDKT